MTAALAIPKPNIDYTTLIIFVILFIFFVFLGFYGSRWRRGDLSKLGEWALAGRRLGVFVVWFLFGADLYTAYTFIALPAAVFSFGAIFFYAVPFVAWAVGIGLLIAPRLWTVSKNRGYITAADFVKDRFNSKLLSILVAIVCIFGELPYIALQILGMRSALTMLLLGLGIGTSSSSSLSLVNEISLLVAFIILAAFTYTSGLRGAALTAIFKDAIVLLTVIVSIITIPIAIGGFHTAFANIPPNEAAEFYTLPNNNALEFFSLALGSAIALSLYPHATNASLSANSKRQLKLSIPLSAVYGIGLALLALIGILAYGIPQVLSTISTLSPTLGSDNAVDLVVPAAIAYTLPSWFVGIALIGIFIGGLVPAAIMAIAIANLFTRNIVKEFRRLSEKGETTLAKWMSAIFKFAALGFVFAVPSYAIILQLLGGIIITQAMPAVYLGLYTNKMEKYSLTAGLVAGSLSGIFLFLYTRGITVSTPFGDLYIALISLGINLLITGVGTAIAYALGWRPKSLIREEEIVRSL